MNNPYYISFRRHLFLGFFSFWKKYKIIGHAVDQKTDKMIIYFENGSIKEIVKWSSCEIFLNTDWVLATKLNLESQAGQTIPLNVKKAE